LHSKLHLPHKEQTQHRKEDLAQDMRGSGRCGAENLENLREWVVGGCGWLWVAEKGETATCKRTQSGTGPSFKYQRRIR